METVTMKRLPLTGGQRSPRRPSVLLVFLGSWSSSLSPLLEDILGAAGVSLLTVTTSRSNAVGQKVRIVFFFFT